jgi:cell wall-associated NlpC family hydrolase
VCSHPKRHGPPKARTFLWSLVATVALLFATGGHAWASPSPSEIEAEIDAKWAQIEPVVEQHNALVAKIEIERKKADALQVQLNPLVEEVNKTRAKAGVYAQYMYMGGGAAGLGAFLDSGDPSVMAERLMSVDALASSMSTRIGDVLVAKSKLDDAKKPLDELLAQLSVLETQQAAQIKEIQSQIDKLGVERISAYASNGGLGALRPVPCPTTIPVGKHAIAIKYACAQIGKRYVFATSGPTTFDCSGLTLAAWKQAGVYLTHFAATQKKETRSISRSELIPGDLVFYYSDVHHVALYAGKINGQDWIVHASNPSKPIMMRLMDQGGNIVGYGRPAD